MTLKEFVKPITLFRLQKLWRKGELYHSGDFIFYNGTNVARCTRTIHNYDFIDVMDKFDIFNNYRVFRLSVTQTLSLYQNKELDRILPSV